MYTQEKLKYMSIPKTCKQLFTAALFKQAKGGNNPNIQVLNGGTKHGIHTMGYYSAIKRDEVCWCMLPHGWTLKT